MKAIAVIPERREVELIDCEAPQITTPTHVKLRMLEVGVCGTDREICAFEYGTPPGGVEHLVIGHESLGEVVEVGAGGDAASRSATWSCRWCGGPASTRTAPPAASERQDFCFTGDFHERGIKEAHGFMTEFVVDDEKYMNVVPRELRDVAVLVEPLTIAEKALAQVWPGAAAPAVGMPGHQGSRRQHCHRAVVIGAGPVGLLGAMALVNVGFDTSVYSRERGAEPEGRPGRGDRCALLSTPTPCRSSSCRRARRQHRPRLRGRRRVDRSPSR